MYLVSSGFSFKPTSSSSSSTQFSQEWVCRKVVVKTFNKIKSNHSWAWGGGRGGGGMRRGGGVRGGGGSDQNIGWWFHCRLILHFYLCMKSRAGNRLNYAQKRTPGPSNYPMSLNMVKATQQSGFGHWKQGGGGGAIPQNPLDWTYMELPPPPPPRSSHIHQTIIIEHSAISDWNSYLYLKIKPRYSSFE